MFFVTSKDELSFFCSSHKVSSFIAQAASKDSLVRAVDVVNGQNCKVAVVAEIAQCDTRAGLQSKGLDSFTRGIESDGHGEKVAVGEARFGDNTDLVRPLQSSTCKLRG